jgi:hypothetical protein
MPCPLFLPASSPSDPDGDECAAQPGAVIHPDKLRHCCETGYARAVCEHAAQSDADAFRFLIKSNRGGVVEVAWSSERNHHPVAVGTLHVSGNGRTGDPLARQARACAEAYFGQSRS